MLYQYANAVFCRSGFNLPMSVTNSGDCEVPTCPTDINANCPGELQVKNSAGEVVGCNTDCNLDTGRIGNSPYVSYRTGDMVLHDLDRHSDPLYSTFWIHTVIAATVSMEPPSKLPDIRNYRMHTAYDYFNSTCPRTGIPHYSTFKDACPNAYGKHHSLWQFACQSGLLC